MSQERNAIDCVHAAFTAVADSVFDRENDNDSTKYGPIAREEREFQELIQQRDFESYLISRLPADRYATIKEIDGVDTLLVDTITIPKEILMEHRDLFQEAFNEMGAVAIGNRSGIASTISGENSDVNDVYELNESRMPRQLLPVLEEALVLRGVDRRKTLSRGTVYDWRGEIADNYAVSGRDPQTAQHLLSLCSTGYFDEDDVFDDIYCDLVQDGEAGLQEYKSILADYIKENPFAVFVRADGMSGKDVYHMARGKLDDLNEYPASPEYVEVCGKGQATHPIIDDARDILGTRHDYHLTTRHNRTIEQKILRIEEDES